MAVVWPSKNNFANGDVLTAANMNNIADTLNVFNPTSATNGQVWTANGSGSGSYQAAGGGMTIIASGSLPATNAVTLSSIPNTYRNLQLSLFNFRPSVADQLNLRINNLSAGNYGWVADRAQGSTVFASAANAQTNVIVDGDYQTTAADAVLIVYLWDYATNSPQVGMNQGVGTMGGPAISTMDQVWRYNAAVIVDRIDLYWSNAARNFNGGTYVLYGVK